MYRHYILIISASIKLQYPFVCVAHNKLSHAAQAQATGFAAQHNSKEVLAKRVHYMCVAGAFSSPLTLSRNFTYTNTCIHIHLLRSRRCRIITPRARFVVGRVDQKARRWNSIFCRAEITRGARTKCSLRAIILLLHTRTGRTNFGSIGNRVLSLQQSGES